MANLQKILSGKMLQQPTRSHDIDDRFTRSLRVSQHGPMTKNVRQSVHRAVTSYVGEALVTMVIAFNFVIIAIETDHLAKDPDAKSGWITAMNFGFLGFFILEISLRMFAYQSLFFQSGWNWLDLLIILSDAMCVVLLPALPVASSISSLRILSLMRLFRSVKMMELAPQLALIVKGMIRAIEILVWGCGFMLTIVIIFSIFAVQLIHPVNNTVAANGLYDACERCPRAFESVAAASLTFVQFFVTGDSWGLIVIPIIEEAPWAAAFFAIVFVALQLLMMNLILSVIVDTASKVSTEDTKAILRGKETDLLNSTVALKELCGQMDIDESGTLTKQELVDGYDVNVEFRDMLDLMDIKRDELNAVFAILDHDNSGCLNYEEFADELYRMKTQEMHTLLVFIKFSVSTVRSMVEDIRGMLREVPGNCDQKVGGTVERLERSLTAKLSMGSPMQTQAQLHQEMQEWADRANRQHDQLLQHLRDLMQDQSSSRWRAGLPEAIGQQNARAGGGGAHAGSGKREQGDQGGDQGDGTDAHSESNLMPCWRIEKGTRERLINSKDYLEAGSLGSAPKSFSALPRSGTTGSAPDLGAARQAP